MCWAALRAIEFFEAIVRAETIDNAYQPHGSMLVFGEKQLSRIWISYWKVTDAASAASNQPK